MAKKRYNRTDKSGSFLENLTNRFDGAIKQHEDKQEEKDKKKLYKEKRIREIEASDLDQVKQRNVFKRYARNREDRKAAKIDAKESRVEKIRQQREDKKQARREFSDYIENNGGIRESIRHQLNTTGDNIRHGIENTSDKIRDSLTSRVDIIKNTIMSSKVVDTARDIRKVFAPGGLKNTFEDKVDSVKSRVENKAATVKTSFVESKVGQTAKKTKQFFKDEKGFKNKAKFIYNNSAIGNFIQKLVKLGKTVWKFVKTFKIPIAIAGAVIALLILLSNGIFYVISVGKSVGSTPHYYCNPNAPMIEKMSSKYKQYCTYQTFDNSSIAAAAVALSTADIASGQSQINYTAPGLGDLLNQSGANIFVSVVPRIVQTMMDISHGSNGQSWSTNTSSALYASCDFSICMAVLWSGADDNYPTCLGRELYNTGANANPQVQTGYLLASDFNNGLWQELNEGDEILPGDIAVSNYTKNGESKGHTWMYVARWVPEPTASDPWAGHWEESDIVQAKYPGSNANRYEGSHESYYAKLSHTDNNPWKDSHGEANDPNGIYKIFRYVGTINEGSPYIGITP